MDSTHLPPLDAEATAMVDKLALEVVKHFSRLNLNCVVLLSGRGYERLAIAEDGQFDAPLMLASAYASLSKRNEATRN